MQEKKPLHLGVIMDGNRRWARQHLFSSVMRGHEKGVETFINLCEWCENAGIPYLTVYAFSTENWKRAQEEVRDLFALMRRFFTEEIHRCVDMGVSVHVVGSKDRFDPEDLRVLEEAERLTKDGKKLYLQIALSYGGRDELLRAAMAYAADVQAGRAFGDALDEEAFSSYLYTAGVPDMDLVIRTGGDHRLSNFFPWQTTYADLWFTDVLWPDFSEELLAEALAYFESVRINKGR